MKIVVARYTEDVEWTKQFPNVLIINKGEKLNNDYNEIFLNNVGREGHSYYKYIYDNYDNLDDYTIFLQGRPFDHSPNIIENINKYINNKELNIDFEFLSESIIHTTLYSDAKNLSSWTPQNVNIYKTWERVFGEKKSGSDECIFGAGSQFIVSKNIILKRSRDFYGNIVNILGNAKDPFEGYDIERFHKYIFE